MRKTRNPFTPFSSVHPRAVNLNPVTCDHFVVLTLIRFGTKKLSPICKSRYGQRAGRPGPKPSGNGTCSIGTLLTSMFFILYLAWRGHYRPRRCYLAIVFISLVKVHLIIATGERLCYAVTVFERDFDDTCR